MGKKWEHSEGNVEESEECAVLPFERQPKAPDREAGAMCTFIPSKVTKLDRHLEVNIEAESFWSSHIGDQRLWAI